MRRFYWLLLAVMLAAVALPVGQVRAQDPTPLPDTSAISDDEVNAVAQTLYCPVCENIPLDVCPTQACAQWRELIRLRLAEGWSTAEIQNYFAQQYGDRVLAMPPARGLNWLVYVLPPIVLLAGLLIVINVMRGMRQRKAAPAAEKPAARLTPAQDDYASRIEEELKRRRS